MKNKILTFLILSLTCITSGAFADATQCKDLLVSELTNLLTRSTIDTKSNTLASDVQKILKPKFEDILLNNATCKNVHNDLLSLDGTVFSVPFSGHTFDIEFDFDNTLVGNIPQIEKPDELESVMPWYGILVVKKGSLDKYANSDVPIISSEYMKSHKDDFYPANSDRFMGLRRGCTHGNHMAADNDVVNRAAHLTLNEDDSFFTGNDYYVYDGEDVYWGWASIAGEVALALATFGISAEASAAKASIKTASGVVQASSAALKGAKAVDLVSDTEKLKKAAKAAKAAKKGTKAAEKASRADAITALSEVGIQVPKGTKAAEIVKIGNSLEKAIPNIKTFSWKSTLTGLAKPWRAVGNGVKQLKPANLNKLLGKGVTWGNRFKVLAPTAAVAGVSFWHELAKAWGYSTSSVKVTDNVKFNGFGLLSADDLEDRENEVSHGAWLQFDEIGQANDGDAFNEALAFAELFQQDMQKINTEDPLCDVDIYVVQPGISNPEKLKTREVYYIIQNPGGSLRVSVR